MSIPFHCNQAERKFLDQLFSLAIEVKKELDRKKLDISPPIPIQKMLLYGMEMDIVFHKLKGLPK